jgi:hypothetical protein
LARLGLVQSCFPLFDLSANDLSGANAVSIRYQTLPILFAVRELWNGYRAARIYACPRSEESFMPQPKPGTVLPKTSFGDRQVTIYIGTKKHEATQLQFRRGPRPPYCNAYYFEFKPKGARNLRYFEDLRGRTVVVDGWGHPEFDWLLRPLAEAPSVDMSPGISVQSVSYTVQPGGDQNQDKYKLEFERYLQGLNASQILLDTRPTTT